LRNIQGISVVTFSPPFNPQITMTSPDGAVIVVDVTIGATEPGRTVAGVGVDAVTTRRAVATRCAQTLVDLVLTVHASKTRNAEARVVLQAVKA